MCGILFHIGHDEISRDHPALEIIKHRGPDGFDAVSFPVTDELNVGMGHRRLAIIDLTDRGSQPMSYDNERYWVTFNGEIYNYLELKKELSDSGFNFTSDSDTEVLLASYKKWGKECVSRFNGMFAFCIYDKIKRKIFIVRDRFGIKPLYFWNSHKGFYAVSEIKQFTCIEGFKPAVNYLKLYHFLTSGDFSFDEETLWDHVYELQPGHYMEISLDKWKPGDPVSQIPWYNLDVYSRIRMKPPAAATEFRKRFQNAVRLRLRADVPIGFLLSGGLDSSSLTGMSIKILQNEKNPLKTFSSCYENSSIDEREFIQEMLNFSNASSSLHFPQPNDFADNLDKVIWHNDLPIRPGSPVPHWLLYKHIKEDNDSRKVILEGQGSDEILCGYRDFFWSELYELLSPFSFGTFLSELLTIRKKHHYSLKVILRKFQYLGFPSTMKNLPNHTILTNMLLDRNDNALPAVAIRRDNPSIPEMHLARMTILRYILHNVDRNSMAHSRETRVPFLDHKLVEFCLSLPTHLKISHGLTKQVLRNSMEGFIPEKIRLREDKQGYSSPVGMWVKNELQDFLVDNIDAIQLPFIRKKVLMKDIDKYLKGEGEFEQFWWWLITVDHWLKIFKISL